MLCTRVVHSVVPWAAKIQGMPGWFYLNKFTIRDSQRQTLNFLPWSWLPPDCSAICWIHSMFLWRRTWRVILSGSKDDSLATHPAHLKTSLLTRTSQVTRTGECVNVCKMLPQAVRTMYPRFWETIFATRNMGWNAYPFIWLYWLPCFLPSGDFSVVRTR